MVLMNPTPKIYLNSFSPSTTTHPVCLAVHENYPQTQKELKDQETGEEIKREGMGVSRNGNPRAMLFHFWTMKMLVCAFFDLRRIKFTYYRNFGTVHAARDADGDSIGGEDEELEEEEVFALEGLSDEDEEDQQDDEQDEDVTTSLPKTKNAKSKSTQPSPPPSDQNSDSESEEEGWGSKKSTYYSTNHTRDEEDFELEAAEALRIQRKAAEAVDESRGDFGLPSSTDAILDSASVTLPGDETKEEEVTKTKEVVDSESIALARDWSDTVKSMTILEAKLSKYVSLFCFISICVTKTRALYQHGRKRSWNTHDAFISPNDVNIHHHTRILLLHPLFPIPSPCILQKPNSRAFAHSQTIA